MTHFERLRRIADDALALDDPWLCVDVARAFRRVAGLDPTWPPQSTAERLAASPAHARGLLLDALDEAEARLLGCEKRERFLNQY